MLLPEEQWLPHGPVDPALALCAAVPAATAFQAAAAPRPGQEERNPLEEL